MKNEATRKAAEFYKTHRRKKHWLKIVTCLAAVVVFCTTYALILPAITLENEVYCGKTEHTHSEECYEEILTCTIPESEGHSHTESCYEEVSVLGCGLEETEGHSHTEECYDDAGQLICGQEESSGHTHTEDCYVTQYVLSCGQEETEGHVHTEDCYESVLTCGLEEHVHTLACASNPDADVETAADWESSLEKVELTGVWAEDLPAIAESQLGYAESTENYQVEEDGKTIKGYTRYGEWYGQPYGDWSAMFVSFCLNYANIPEEIVPREADVQRWVEKLSGGAEGYEDYSLYTAAKDYIPNPGDLVFFDSDGDGSADQVGILAEYAEASLLNGGRIKTIEGDSDNKVQYASYDPDDERIVGYAALPENPELGIVALDADGYDEVPVFYLWLKLRENDEIKDIYSNPEWVNDKGFVGEGISDALTYTDDAGKWYLIPVSYFETNYAGYGYTFDSSVNCPFKYLPDASKSDSVTADSLVDAAYVCVGETWYVRVQDTGSYGDNEPPRSNIYFTPSNSFTLTYDGKTITFNVVDQNGKAIYGDYSQYNIDAAGSTKYVFGIGNKAERTEAESGAVEEIGLPSFEGYTYTGAKYGTNPVASVATTGYVNCRGVTYGTVSDNFQFYITEPMTDGKWYSRNENVSVTLTYEKEVEVVKNAVSPNGTVINLFDYWVTAEHEDDVSSGNINYNAGINKDHALKFTPSGPGSQGNNANKYTGGANVYTGIVANTLKDGYPALSGKTIFHNNTELISSGEALSYLFDPTYEGESAAYRNAYRNVGGLLQVDGEGYYYFDSKQNYAEFNKDTNSFRLYKDWAVHHKASSGNDTNGQFFPFDPFDTVTQTTLAGSSSLNHYFGMTLTARFVQRYEGHTDAGKKTAMEFDFTGDDDVWIFIDDVLVADLGGIHDAADVVINFANGDVTVNGVKKTTIKEAFTSAGKGGTETDWRENTFADNTYHTLKFFYLERGSYASNLRLKYNLTEIPSTGIYKVNQYGDAVEGAEFSVYRCDEQWKIIGEAVYTGTTNAKGEMIFLDQDNMPYSIKELQAMFGSQFILKETMVPDGYRLVSDEIHLRIANNVLLCEDSFESGAWASANLLVSAPTTLKLVDGTTRTYYNPESQNSSAVNGSVFAVVLKYIGDDAGNASADNLKKQENWAPVYGTDETGFTVVDIKDHGGSFTAAAIATAQKYVESQPVFALSSGGQMQGKINGMPGDISTYYYMLGENDKAKTQYTVAYYWTSQSITDGNWTGVTDQNTFRIDADAKGNTFERVFGATIQVPNLVNRLIVQKLGETEAEDGTKTTELVNGAAFGLYAVKQDDDADNTVWYLADDGTTKIYLAPDTDGDNRGTAKVNDQSYVYQVDSDGTIKVGTEDENTGAIDVVKYTIKPVQTDVTRDQTAGTRTSDDEKLVGEAGSLSFTNMENGFYYLREIAAPEGYRLNSAEVMVLVDDTAVYANAGTKDDGIIVARGPGYMVATLDMFASQGQIDNTLSWVYEQLLVSPVSSRFSDVYSALGANGSPAWQYLKENYNPDLTDENGALTTHLVYDKGGEETLYNYTVNDDWYTKNQSSSEGVTRRLYTSVGWSYYLLYQDYDYGKNCHKDGAIYEDLEGKEISNLFSRSTFVQVSDPKVSNLKISKTVADVNKSAEKPDQTPFTFTVKLYTLTNAEDGEKTETDLTGSYTYTVYNSDSTVASHTVEKEETFVEEDYTGSLTSGDTVTLMDGQYVLIEDLPYDAYYTVTEAKTEKYTAAVAQNGGAAADGYAASGQLFWRYETGSESGDAQTVLNNTSVVAFTNTPFIDFTIRKVDGTGQNAALTGAQFVLYYTDDERKYYQNGTFKVLAEGKTEADAAVTVSGETDDAEKGTFTFKAVPAGTYTLKEIKAPDGYNLLNSEITVTVTDGEVKMAVGGTTNYNIADMTITIPNSSGITLPNTGGPGTAQFSIIGLALICCAGTLLYINQRKRKETIR